MKILVEGHKYELENHENKSAPGQAIQFIQKEKVHRADGEDEFKTVSDGTTNEEVLAVLIDRLKTMYVKLPSHHTQQAIENLQDALMWLNARTAERKARNVEGTPKA